MMKIFLILMAFSTFVINAMANDESYKLVPFLLKSENPLDYNQQVIAQRNLIRGRRIVDQERKIKGKFARWFTQRPHAFYQRVLEADAPVVVTPTELPSEIIFYDLFPELRKVARIDYSTRRHNDRQRFIDYDRHQTIFGETVYEEITGRYLDSEN